MKISDIAEIVLFSSPCLGILFSRDKKYGFKKDLIQSFRPHAWGFFFHLIFISDSKLKRPVFVPMFGDSFFTQLEDLNILEIFHVFVPMFGDPFFTVDTCFPTKAGNTTFSSPCLGILFSQVSRAISRGLSPFRFRPHVWGFFFHKVGTLDGATMFTVFSSPCLGILFSRQRMTVLLKVLVLFSSPCLGILFSQQAWDAPRGGLSMALLRRGFPIDWNSHYFHPLTFCFLRFHAHRRGFSK